MKYFVIILLILCASAMLFACGNENVTDGTDSSGGTDTAGTDAPDDEAKGPTVEDIDNYKNSILKVTHPDAWQYYGVGDPFVMRYNGRYYLYCSTKDGEVGIQCWISDDLVNWTYEGMCAKEALTRGAYAPEVVYYNGSFYMYTSPEGKGHYVLKSDSPTGPFTAVTGNFGLTIDGSVYIDDDGSWYFCSAYQGGIGIYPMTAPDKVNGDAGVLLPYDMCGWTEGPMVVKHDGVYYMTYTGNMVWSPGYRIHCAVSTTSIMDLKPVESNPIMVSSDYMSIMGPGHNSTVVGPNLDEYYIVYHSYKTVPKRSMNIDRIIFNGSETVALGPTGDAQQAPSMPDVYSRFETEADLAGWSVTDGGITGGELILSEGGRVLSEKTLEGDYTAEFNFKRVGGTAGFLFGYTDGDNHGSAAYETDTGRLAVEFTVNGVTVTKRAKLTASFSDTLRSDALITFKVVKSGNEYTFFANGREIISAESELGDGSLGVFSEKGSTAVGFVGGTSQALQSTAKDVYKPAESKIPAFTAFVGGEDVIKRGAVMYMRAAPGGEYSYKVNVSRSGKYDLVFEYTSNKECVLTAYQGEKKLGEITLPSSSGVTTSVAARGFDVAEGISDVTFRVEKGSADLLNFYFHSSKEVEAVTEDFEKGMNPSYSDGEWRLKDGKMFLAGDFGKYMIGSEDWGNYVVEGDITLNSDRVNAGICVRVSNPATRADDIGSATDYLQGYFIGLESGSIVLGKHNYDWTELKRVEFQAKKGDTFHMTVEVEENVIRVSVDGKEIMTYTDYDRPFLHGMAGVRTHVCSIAVDDLSVRKLSK